MKLNVLRLVIVSLACATAFVVITRVRAQKSFPVQKQFANSSFALGAPKPAQTPVSTASQEPTVEQVEKNIKILNGMPASQLIPVMNYFAASMGRRCNFCHVNNQGQWDYASDTKPEKNTAREMIRLVLDTNKTLAGLKLDPIACYTCHRGRNTPQSLPTLPLPLPSPPPANRSAGAAPTGAGTPGAAAQASPVPTPALPSADDIFNKYVAAIGGQGAVDKLTSRVAKGTIAQANGNSFQFELYQSGPDKFGVREISGVELANFRAANSLFSFINLKAQYSRPPRVRRDKLNDRDVYVLDGQTTDGRRMRLYFDATTGLLLRRVTILTTVIGLIPDQVDFEDYRDLDGVKFAFVGRSATVEAGNPTSTRTFTEVKINVPVDDSKFKMPAAAAKP
ncbi:MAG: c-type cytochrome [Acidobacteria bacterium]|nr:MAG: c-type cytochrome [Acidobacteriota bacterium]